MRVFSNALGLVDLISPRLSALPPLTALYAPPLPLPLYMVLVGPRIVLLSVMLWATAAFLTLRWRDHASIARQAKIVAPKSPRIPPTAMNTVPSG